MPAPVHHILQTHRAQYCVPAGDTVIPGLCLSNSAGVVPGGAVQYPSVQQKTSVRDAATTDYLVGVMAHKVSSAMRATARIFRDGAGVCVHVYFWAAKHNRNIRGNALRQRREQLSRFSVRQGDRGHTQLLRHKQIEPGVGGLCAQLHERSGRAGLPEPQVYIFVVPDFDKLRHADAILVIYDKYALHGGPDTGKECGHVTNRRRHEAGVLKPENIFE